MRVIVCGDRNWGALLHGGKQGRSRAYSTMRERLSELPKGTVIIEGGARGADSMAKGIGHEEGFLVVEYQANWDHQHRTAGPIRNAAMLSCSICRRRRQMETKGLEPSTPGLQSRCSPN